MSNFWKNFAAIALPAALSYGAAWAQGASVRQGTGSAIAAVIAALAALHTTAPADQGKVAPPSATGPAGVA